MSTTATRKWVVLMVVCAGAFGAGGVFAFTPGKEPQPPTNAPLAKEQPAPRAPADDPGVWGDTDPKGKVPSAFPKLLPPELKGDKADLLKALTKACPEILGPLPNANADDDTSDEDENQYRRLLLTQLQQGRFESRVLLQKVLAGGATAETFDALTRCLTTMRATVLAFWGQERSQRLRLVSWMEEFVVLGKAIERVADGRAETDPRAIFAARGHRVAAEVALWKAKNKR